MLVMPPGSLPIFNIVGIDPGTEFLGVAAITIDFEKFKILSTQAHTFRGSKLSKDSWLSEVHGDRFGRIIKLQEQLTRYFRLTQPFFIACESPFFSFLHPNALGTLTEVLCMIRNTLVEYDHWKQLDLVDPPSAKRAVGASGNAKKEEVKQKILSLSELNYCGSTSLTLLDEHSIDAIAIAYWRFKLFMETSCSNL